MSDSEDSSIEELETEFNENGPSSSRNWVFTYFHYLIEDIDFLLTLHPNPCKGIIFQEEICPDTGLPHLQGFLRFQRGYSFQQVKGLLPLHMQHIHLEPAKSPFDAVEYCRKGDTRMATGCCYEEGDLIFNQGKSRDLAEAYELINKGCSYSELVRAFPIPCIRHHRGLQFVKDELDAERDVSFRPVKVFTITGHSGAGKTRAAYGYDPRLYKLDRAASGRDIWFDGYDRQRTLLIDDFYGWIPHGQLLNILDGYPLRLPTKGSHRRAAFETIILTSNSTPPEWYRRRYPDGLQLSLARRITGFFEATLQTTYEDIQDWLQHGDHRSPETGFRSFHGSTETGEREQGAYVSLLARNFRRTDADGSCIRVPLQP